MNLFLQKLEFESKQNLLIELINQIPPSLKPFISEKHMTDLQTSIKKHDANQLRKYQPQFLKDLIDELLMMKYQKAQEELDLKLEEIPDPPDFLDQYAKTRQAVIEYAQELSNKQIDLAKNNESLLHIQKKDIGETLKVSYQKEFQNKKMQRNQELYNYSLKVIDKINDKVQSKNNTNDQNNLSLQNLHQNLQKCEYKETFSKQKNLEQKEFIKVFSLEKNQDSDQNTQIAKNGD